LVVGLLLFSLVAGVAVIGNGLLVWPVLTLAGGAFCGVAVFLDEQAGAYRFLGEQRFPLGRIWLAKVALYAGIVFPWLLVALVPGVGVRSVGLANHPNQLDRGPLFVRLFGSRLLDGTIPPKLFLFLWPAYGFAVGCLCGLLFRKPLVALVSAFGLGVALASV